MLAWPRPMQALRRDELPGTLDPWVLAAALALAAFGVVMVASSSIPLADGGKIGAFYYLERHLIFLVLGSALAFALLLTPLETLEENARVLLFFAVLLLLAVFVPGFGRRINGARRWLNLGFTSFQAVEAVKLMFIVYLASYL